MIFALFSFAFGWISFAAPVYLLDIDSSDLGEYECVLVSFEFSCESRDSMRSPSNVLLICQISFAPLLHRNVSPGKTIEVAHLSIDNNATPVASLRIFRKFGSVLVWKSQFRLCMRNVIPVVFILQRELHAKNIANHTKSDIES